jgi:hypothetical protein
MKFILNPSIRIAICGPNHFFIDLSFGNGNEPAAGATGYIPQIAQVRVHGHVARTIFSSSEEDPLDEDEEVHHHVRVNNCVQMRRQLLHQARTHRIAQDEEEEQVHGKNKLGCSTGASQKQTSFTY